MIEVPALIAVERFLQAFRAVSFEPSRTSFYDSKLPDKQAGFRHSQCMTDQMFKLTYDVKYLFEENKSSTVLADLTTAHGSLSLLYGTKAKHPTNNFDFLLLL